MLKISSNQSIKVMSDLYDCCFSFIGPGAECEILARIKNAFPEVSVHFQFKLHALEFLGAPQTKQYGNKFGEMWANMLLGSSPKLFADIR